MRFALAGLSTLALATGCGGGGDGPDADGGPDIDARTDLPDARPGPAFPATITIAASDGMITVPFRADISGSAPAPLGGMTIAGDVGSLTIDATASPGFVYVTQQFSGYNLFQGFAVGPTRWHVFWMYCQAGGLPYIYDEGVDGPALFYRNATGTCAASGTMTTATVALPALAMPAPTPLGGYLVDGPDVFVRTDGTGALTLGGQTMPLIVFGDVDCAACGGTGWFELHSIVWDDAQHRAVFVIVYLINDSPASVQLAYVRSLPDLADPIGSLTLPATWTASPSAPARARALAAPHLGMPPPSLILAR